jgi:hypothetical protein
MAGLRTVYGMGARKLDELGELVLETIHAHASTSA